MKTFIVRYKLFLGLLALAFSLLLFLPDIGSNSARNSLALLTEMLVIVPPVFLLLGLFDVWVPKETIMKSMGTESGLLGILLAFMLGSFAAGPLYAAFPVAAALMNKGCKFSNLLIFMGAWSTTKIPMLLFEAGSISVNYMLLRLALNIPGILIIAFLMDRMLTFSPSDN